MPSAADLGFVHRFKAATDPDAGPALLLLHGTGGNENDLIPLGWELAPGAALLSPRGKVLEQGMPRFFRRLAEGVFDLDDLRARTAELASFVRAAEEAYGLPAGGTVAAGYSNGANIAAALLLLHPGTLAGAVLFRAMVPLEPDPLPDLGGAPVHLSAGRADTMVPGAETERLAGLLGRAGASVTLDWRDAGHGLVREDVAAASTWLRGTFARK
jgi:predicted esterase